MCGPECYENSLTLWPTMCAIIRCVCVMVCARAGVCVCAAGIGFGKGNSNQHLARAQPGQSSAELRTGDMSTYAPLSRHRRQRPRHISDIYTSQQFQTADDNVSHDLPSLLFRCPPSRRLRPTAILDTLGYGKVSHNHFHCQHFCDT